MCRATKLITLAVAALELGIAGYYSGNAINQSRHILMQGPKKPLAARPTLDELIWSRASPSAHDYFLAHVFATVGFACLSVLAIAQGPLLGGLLYISLTLVGPVGHLGMLAKIPCLNRVSADGRRFLYRAFVHSISCASPRRQLLFACPSYPISPARIESPHFSDATEYSRAMPDDRDGKSHSSHE